MSLEFPSPGGMLDAMRSLAASKGRPMRMLRRSLTVLLPILMLALGGGCHHGSNADAVGTPPSITLQPVDTPTVSGRQSVSRSRPMAHPYSPTNGPRMASISWAPWGPPSPCTAPSPRIRGTTL